MNSRSRNAAAVLLAAVALSGCSPAVRPAASGTAVAPVAQSRATGGAPPVTAADVSFMAGMIVHHAQAVLMASWAPSHDAGPAVREVCARIAVSQRDEIAFMQHWLEDHHQAVPQVDTETGRMLPSPGQGMDMSGAGGPMMMPGMLNAAQLAQLDSARGSTFDHLFLTYMIQHHEGALTMVQSLVNTPGAAQDPLVFQFASDISAGQAAEIDRMRHVLAASVFGSSRVNSDPTSGATVRPNVSSPRPGGATPHLRFLVAAAAAVALAACARTTQTMSVAPSVAPAAAPARPRTRASDCGRGGWTRRRRSGTCRLVSTTPPPARSSTRARPGTSATSTPTWRSPATT